MTILIHDYGGYPFIYDLSKGLSLLGHRVIHIFSSASGSPSRQFAETDLLRVIDLGKDLEKVNKSSFVERYRQESHYGKLIAEKILEVMPDVVISANTPLEAQKKIAETCFKRRIYLIHWLQDILSVAAEDVLRKRSQLLGWVVGRYFRRIEKRCLSLADRVVVISEDFSRVLREWGVPENKLSVIENWSNVDDIPLLPKVNPFSKEHSITDTFNIVYSGTLGMKQNPDMLIRLAEAFREDAGVKFVLVANGSGVGYVVDKIRSSGLENFLVLPLQPFHLVPQVLASGDLLLAMLDSSFSDYCVPSKILTYYCAGRATLLVLNKSNLGAKKTLEHGLGYVVAPGEVESLKSIIQACMADRNELIASGQRARQYAEAHFSTESIVGQFLPLITKASL